MTQPNKSPARKSRTSATPPKGYRIVTQVEKDRVRHLSGWLPEYPTVLRDALIWNGQWKDGPFRFFWDDRQYAVPAN